MFSKNHAQSDFCRDFFESLSSPKVRRSGGAPRRSINARAGTRLVSHPLQWRPTTFWKVILPTPFFRARDRDRDRKSKPFDIRKSTFGNRKSLRFIKPKLSKGDRLRARAGARARCEEEGKLQSSSFSICLSSRFFFFLEATERRPVSPM